MLVHSVYFWLKKNLTKKDRESFFQGLESLEGIIAVESLYIGTPSSTDRPVVDRSYDYALTAIMKDLNAHDDYQASLLHQAFLEKFSSYWSKVIIYDHELRNSVSI